MTHPSEDLRAATSQHLLDKTIVLGVTGSIAAAETVKLARELVRHGAIVVPVMTESACRILHPDALWFATGVRPVTVLTGEVEHVQYCGQRADRASLFLIAPCTANTLAKIALGIDDTPVTTFATTALGSHVPVLLVPAMHGAMYDNPFVTDNLQRCQDRGIHLLEPQRAEGAVKMVSCETIVADVIRLAGRRDWVDRRVLIIGGRTAEPVDPVRVLSNRSSGKMALALARTAYHRGAQVDLWYHGLTPPLFLSATEYTTHADLVRMIEDAGQYDCIINAAAITDFTVDQQAEKISSDHAIDLHLDPVLRLNPLLRRHTKTLVGFKLELDQQRAVERGIQTLQKDDCDYIVANTAATLEQDTIQAWIIDRDQTITAAAGEKAAVAETLFDLIQ